MRISNNTDGPTPVSAIVLVISAGLLFSFLDTSAKYLVVGGMQAPFVSWMRFLVHLLLVLILFRPGADRRMLAAGSLPLQVLRGACLFGATFFNFLALNTLQLAQTMSILFFAPMVITALAGPLLGEWAGLRRWAAIAAGFAGVLVITRPGVAAFEIGQVYAFCSMLSYSFYVIMTRSMGATETPESLIFYSALAPVVLMLPAVPATASMPEGALQWVVLLSLGFYGGFGHWLLIKAYKKASTTALAPYPYLQMVWMIFFGFVVFDQLPDGFTLAGAAIIVASGLYIVHRERQLRLARSAALQAEDQQLAKKL